MVEVGASPVQAALRMRCVQRAWRAGRATTALTPLLAAACSLTPDYEAPALVSTFAETERYGAASGMRAHDASPVRLAWWEGFGGAELSALVEAMTADNLDLAAARERVDQARALTRQARAARLPSLTASVEAGGVRAPTFTRDAAWDELYSVTGAAAWDLDIFGGLRNAQRSAQLSEASSALAARALDQVLIAELVTAYINAWALSRRIAIARDTAESFAETATLTDQRYRAGSSQASALDVQIARQNQASAEAAIPELRALLAVQRQAIDVLLARPPGRTRVTFAEPPDAWALAALDPGAPADLLRRRPDVAVAELNYRAALADIGSARAQRYPSLSLSGSVTWQQNAAANPFDPEALIASLTAGLVRPVFQGGRLKAQVALAEAAARELASAYAAAALQAVAEVENALVFEAAYREEIALRRVSLEAAEVSDRVARERYASGQATILTVLETQRALNTARQDLVLAEQTRLDARVDLYLALGGDWRPARPSHKDEDS